MIKQFKLLSLLSIIAITSSLPASAYRSGDTIIINRSAKRKKSLLQRKFVFTQEQGILEEESSNAYQSNQASGISPQSSPKNSKSISLMAAPKPVSKASNKPQVIKTKAKPTGGLNAAKHNKANALARRVKPKNITKTKGSSSGSSATEEIGEDVFDEDNWDALAVETEASESFDVNAKLLKAE